MRLEQTEEKQTVWLGLRDLCVDAKELRPMTDAECSGVWIQWSPKEDDASGPVIDIGPALEIANRYLEPPMAYLLARDIHALIKSFTEVKNGTD